MRIVDTIQYSKLGDKHVMLSKSLASRPFVWAPALSFLSSKPSKPSPSRRPARRTAARALCLWRERA